MPCGDHPLCSLADGHFKSCDLQTNTHILSSILFNAQQSSHDLCTSLQTIALNKCPVYGFGFERLHAFTGWFMNESDFHSNHHTMYYFVALMR
jgi:hypothetical protein